MTPYEEKRLELEEKKIATLEKIATSVDILTLWFEEIDKEDWDNRLQFYLTEFHKAIVMSNEESGDEIEE
jgi:hypothetical protein